MAGFSKLQESQVPQVSQGPKGCKCRRDRKAVSVADAAGYTCRHASGINIANRACEDYLQQDGLEFVNMLPFFISGMEMVSIYVL